ncbi:MAG: IS3 family transposase [Actinobacteria bacterium]|nr:MAG: IS3 family transposase [Actinomycetota bacterium]
MTAHIETQRTDHQIPIATSLRALGVSESWFYKHRGRPATPTRQRRDALDAAIVEVFAANDGEYGSPRVHAELIERPEWAELSVNTVAERMQAQGLVAKKKRRRRSLTRPDPHAPKFENLIRRDFNPPAPNVTWCGDITEIPTWEGKLYLATVIDLYSRRLIGFAIAEHCKAALVCDAMRMALATRGGHVAGVIMHTDRGSQYTANAFVELCRRHRIVQSMSRSGSCLDNAAAESFFATLKTELVYRVVLATKSRARRQLIRWFDRYNQTRRHSHCGWRAPIAYEKIDTPARRAA